MFGNLKEALVGIAREMGAVPSGLQIFPDSEIFRLSFIRLCPNAEEVLFTEDPPAPPPVWVRKSGKFSRGLSGFWRVRVIVENSQSGVVTGVVTSLRVYSTNAGL